MSKDIYLAKNPVKKLLIKKHKITGLKYLCVTTRKDHKSYSGSGQYWKRHLKVHGNHINTICIFKSRDEYVFMKQCLRMSERLNVVESPNWANLMREEGGVRRYGMRLPAADPKKITATKKKKMARLRKEAAKDYGFPMIVTPAGFCPTYSLFYKNFRRLKKAGQLEMWPKHWLKKDDRYKNVSIGYSWFVHEIGMRPSMDHLLLRKNEKEPHSKENTYWGYPPETITCEWCGTTDPNTEGYRMQHLRYHGKRCKKNPNSIGHLKERTDYECEHCGRDGLTGGNYSKYHGDNCKQNPNFDPQNNTRPVVSKNRKVSDKKKKSCPHCSIRVAPHTFLKYHGDSCKQNPEYDPSKDRYRNGDVECKHCGKKGTQSNYTKFHGDNCPENPEYDASKDKARKNSMKGLSKTPSWRNVRLPKEASAA